MRRFSFLPLLVSSLLGAEGPAPEKAPVPALPLGAPLLSEGQTQRELDALILSRVPPLTLPPSREEWSATSASFRSRVLEHAVFWGWPKEISERRALVRYTQSEILAGPGYKIKKLLYEPFPGLWIPALLYEPEGLKGRAPAVLNVNGHVGSPGKAIEYKQIRCINLAKRGMIALNPEWYAFGELSGPGYGHSQIAYIDLCGKSGLAMFYLALRGGIDVLLGHPQADPERVAVTGLSGGGWQTIVLSSLDERVKACAPNAGYIGLATRILNNGDVGDLEQNPADLLLEADYTHLTAMLLPRPALLIYNRRDDCCFPAERARASVYLAALPFYRRFAPWAELSFHENFEPGDHNYGFENRQAFYRFLNRLWVSPRDRVDDELPASAEVRSFDELKVGVPKENATFVSIALELARSLPHHGAEQLKEDRELRQRVRQGLRKALRLTEARVEHVEKTALDGGTGFRLRLSSGLTLPAVELKPEEGAFKPRVTVLLDDEGRSKALSRAGEIVKQGRTVLVADILFTGELRPNRLVPWQASMFLANVGLRALGEETSEVLALAAWARRELGAGEVSVEARGEITGMAALLAAAVDGDEDARSPLLDRVKAEGAPSTLKDLLRNGTPYDAAAPLFCPGLLEEADVPELLSLARPEVPKK
jgi:dienelactone hydrolase